jgi:hypothetical protein
MTRLPGMSKLPPVTSRHLQATHSNDSLFSSEQINPEHYVGVSMAAVEEGMNDRGLRSGERLGGMRHFGFFSQRRPFSQCVHLNSLLHDFRKELLHDIKINASLLTDLFKTTGGRLCLLV